MATKFKKQQEEEFQPEDLLTPGSAWVSNKSSKRVVTVLFVTNMNAKQDFIEANPPVVVFLTPKGNIFHLPMEEFIERHEFVNVTPEYEAALNAIVSGDLSMFGEEAEQDQEQEQEQGDDSGKQDTVVHQAMGSKPAFTISFATDEQDRRRDPLLNSEMLASALSQIESSPIIVYNDGLSIAGTQWRLIFNDASADFERLIDSVFSPDSINKNYIGFVVNDTQVDNFSYLGVSRIYNNGEYLVVTGASLDDMSESEEEVEEGFAEEPAPVEKPRSISELAAVLSQQQAEGQQEDPSAHVSSQTASNLLSVST